MRPRSFSAAEMTVGPSPDAKVDMARHVHEVARARNGAAQPIGVRFGAFRPVRRLNRVDIVVHRAWVGWIPGEHAL
jgi:uncharacterized membrane protein YcjF (UPF0283 family)